MAKITGTCPNCKSKINIYVTEGIFFCHNCHKQFCRWYNAETENYEIDEFPMNIKHDARHKANYESIGGSDF